MGDIESNGICQVYVFCCLLWYCIDNEFDCIWIIGVTKVLGFAQWFLSDYTHDTFALYTIDVVVNIIRIENNTKGKFKTYILELTVRYTVQSMRCAHPNQIKYDITWPNQIQMKTTKLSKHAPCIQITCVGKVRVQSYFIYLFIFF